MQTLNLFLQNESEREEEEIVWGRQYQFYSVSRHILVKQEISFLANLHLHKCRTHCICKRRCNSSSSNCNCIKAQNLTCILILWLHGFLVFDSHFEAYALSFTNNRAAAGGRGGAAAATAAAITMALPKTIALISFTTWLDAAIRAAGSRSSNSRRRRRRRRRRRGQPLGLFRLFMVH